MREFWGSSPEGYTVFSKDIHFSEHVGHWYQFVHEAAATSDAWDTNEWGVMEDSVCEDFMKGHFPEIIIPKEADAQKKKKKTNKLQTF